MGIQENVKRQEAKLAAQAKMQAIQAEQPQTVTPEPTHPGVDVEALRQSIRAELQASRPDPLDVDTIRKVIRAELHASRPEPIGADVDAIREVVRTELHALPAPQTVGLEALRQEMQTVMRTELYALHTALSLLTEAITAMQAQIAVIHCDTHESQGEQDDEVLPTALPSPFDDQDGEEQVFPADTEENEEDAEQLVLSTHRLPCPEPLLIGMAPLVSVKRTRRWEPV